MKSALLWLIRQTRKETVKRAKQIGITTDASNMLKNSLIRTLFYQNQNDDWYLRKSKGEK